MKRKFQYTLWIYIFNPGCLKLPINLADKPSEMVSRIAANSKEQARGTAQIGDALTKIEKVTQSNSASAQETTESASSMTSQIQSTRQHLEDLVSVRS
jgi:methyl-accepting chemotaxis protein